MTGIELIVQERQRQLLEYSLENDKKYEAGELKTLVEYLLLEDNDAEKDGKRDLLMHYGGVQFSGDFLNSLDSKTETEKLTIAGALLAAEIDRIQNK